MMHHHRTRSDANEPMSTSMSMSMSSPRSSRAPSFSSEGSVTFPMSMPAPSSIRPQPAYIAASVASQIVTDNHNAHLREMAADTDESGDLLANALFSEQALNLLNAFLDHLLFAFLSTARSPSLTAIRPAITEVLKPRLARDAMATADEELEGLLAGEDEEEFPAQDGKEHQNWDVEKVWKRTRLRIMVYTRLGELEDEDEERYVQQERGLSMDDSADEDASLVSWASAIFLTSVIEHIAEQTLLLSGQAALARTSAKLKKLARQSLDHEELPLERLVVEEFDVEKLAVNSAIGRLWRTWRKRVRSPAGPMSPRGVRNIASFTSLHHRRTSYDVANELDDSVREVPEHEPTETEIAANIPLPIRDNDINEIEVPGLARTFEEDESSTTETPVTHPPRPSSVIMHAPAETLRRRSAKERPLSMPPPHALPFVVSAKPERQDASEERGSDEAKEVEEAEISDDEADERPFETPMETMSDDGSYIHEERQEGPGHEHDREADGEHEANAAMVAFAASTGMGFGMGPMESIKTADLPKNHEGSNTPTQATYGERTQLLQSKRMSIEKTGPPGIVRTFSTRSSSLKSQGTPGGTPQATPKLEPRSFFDDGNGDDDMSGPEAIGVAHTSNVPIASPSPPSEAGARERSPIKGKHPSHGGYVEVLPRQTAPTSIHVRNTPTPEGKPVPIESSTARKDVQRKDIPTSQLRPRDSTPPRTRGAPLPAVQEAESSWSPRAQSPLVAEKAIQRDSPTRSSPKKTPSLRSREAPVPVTVNTKNVDAPRRSRPETAEGVTPERSPLQRMSSSSSTNRSVGTSILHSGRDSSASLEGRPRGLSERMSEEDRQREFDSLVNGDETVKFTLTPETVRDFDDSPTIKRAEPQRATSSPKTHKSSASVTVYPRVNADVDNGFGSQHLPNRSSSRSKGPVPSSGNKAAMKKALAREPRIQNDSMQDFAEFIRSTGPRPGEVKPVQPFVPLNAADTKPANSSNTSLGGLGRRMSTRKTPSHSQSNSTVIDGPSARPRFHMEARSPAGQRSGNDDLIDFIRQGPPGPNNGQHRIPRSVAPFRTTVDSDQFENMLDDHGTVESAYGSQVSSTSKQSDKTSNSRTDLLPKQKVVHPAYSNTPQKLTGNYSSRNDLSNQNEPVITKTRRRIKDPYAIDSDDDEDEDLLTALPNSAVKQQQQQPPPRRDEGMMDFLNSMEPPPSTSKPEAFVLSPETIAAAKARASAVQNGAPAANMSSSTRNGSSRNGKAPSAQPAIISSTIMSDAPRAHKPRLQARAAVTSDARAGRSATNELADFLKNSGPPEPPMGRDSAPPPGATIRKEEKEGGKRSAAKFWRKKTYPDMP